MALSMFWVRLGYECMVLTAFIILLSFAILKVFFGNKYPMFVTSGMGRYCVEIETSNRCVRCVIRVSAGGNFLSDPSPHLICVPGCTHCSLSKILQSSLGRSPGTNDFPLTDFLSACATCPQGIVSVHV